MQIAIECNANLTHYACRWCITYKKGKSSGRHGCFGRIWHDCVQSTVVSGKGLLKGNALAGAACTTAGGLTALTVAWRIAGANWLQLQPRAQPSPTNCAAAPGERALTQRFQKTTTPHVHTQSTAQVTRAEPHNLQLLHPEQDRVLTIRENARCQVRSQPAGEGRH